MARSMDARYSEILNLRKDIKLRPLLHPLSDQLPLKNLTLGPVLFLFLFALDLCLIN